MSNFLFDNTGSYPQNGVYYTNEYVRTQDIVVGPDGYGLVDPANVSNSSLGHIFQGAGGTTLIYQDVNGSFHTLAGATGSVGDATFIVQVPDASVPNAQAISTLANVEADSVLTVLNPTTGVLAASTRIIDDTYTTGSHDLFVGSFCGNTTLTGSDNVGVGSAALQHITSGTLNVGVGNNALTLCSSGSSNVAVGASSLEAVTTTTNNVGIGVSAGTQLTTSDNVAIGANSLAVNSSGTQNVCVGSSSLSASTGGSNNTSVGFNAGIKYVGSASLNVSVGSLADGPTGAANVGTSGNTTVGANTSCGGGGHCTVLGANASCLIGSNCTAIGYGATLTSQDNVCLITNSVAGSSLGINDPAPLAALSVVGTSQYPAAIQLHVTTTPSPPPLTGNVFLYTKANNQLWMMGTDGTERQITTVP